MNLDSGVYLFVYGTLKRGQRNHPLISDAVADICPGWIRGRLHDLGEFPALAAGDTPVHGEAVRLLAERARDTLAAVDRLEGFVPDNPTGSHYLRVPVAVRLQSGETVTAWAYQYNATQDRARLDAYPLLESGRWDGPSAIRVQGEHPELRAFRGHVRRFLDGVPEDSRGPVESREADRDRRDDIFDD